MARPRGCLRSAAKFDREDSIVKRIGLALAASALFLTSGCSPETDAPTGPKARPFEGQSIYVIVPKLDARLIRGPILDEVDAFEARTGAKVRVLTPGWNETIEKIDQSLKSPDTNFDIYVAISMWSGTLLGGNHIEPVPEAVKRKIDWDDVLPIYRNTVLSWNKVAYGLPYDGDCINLYYRKDLFANTEYQARFRKRYGYDLAPPATWKEFRDIAEFFTGWDWSGDGKPDYGVAGNRIKGDISALQFFAQAAAFAKHPDDPAYYFDPVTLKPRIDNPGFVRALQTWVDTMKFGPPGMANFAGHDVRNAFVSGQVAMAIDWADMGVHAVASPVSVVKDVIGYAQLPGSAEVFDARAGRWDKRSNQVSSISGNWTFFVSRASKHKELAFEFAAHMTSKELTRKLTAMSGTAVNPSRRSHFADPAAWNQSGFATESARAYLQAITQSLSNPNVVYDITIPGAGEYYQAFDAIAYKAVTRELSAKQALVQAAAEWEKITDRLGRDKQVAYYRASLNIDY
ncbi:MAG: extracellular solute-binding protein [Gammaproteobacteria bacterium]|nr:extracellular solute-binding protein [Gammaproteobacteria bacterium]MBU1776806.1 extracellular solute-binding protein [Gammaproteobacteria bacterium]MBU1968166.1 extracellular solute-binding protein [Gammaproteobacteria bacterium]